MREGGGRGVRREGDVVEVGGGAEDAAYDEVGGGGGVLWPPEEGLVGG